MVAAIFDYHARRTAARPPETNLAFLAHSPTMLAPWIPGYRTTTLDPPVDLAVRFDGMILPVDAYASDGEGLYFKAKMPGGGTIEVHLLREDYFS